MFKVLVIAYYFPPLGLSGVQRTTKFVKYFPKYNWQSTVITTDSIGYYATDESLLKEIDLENTKIIRVKGKEVNARLSKNKNIKMPPEIIRKFLSRLSSIFFIPDNKISWCKHAYPVIKDLLNKEHFDLIFVSAPPFSTVNLAVQLKKEFNIPLVIDYRDLWYGYHFAFYPTPFHKSIIKKMERIALTAADKIVVTNRRIKEKILEYYKFLSFNDIVIIPHGFDPEDFEKAREEKKETNKMLITYSGIFYENITPKYFLQAFSEILKEHPEIASDIELHFLGLLRKENKKLISKLKLEKFVVDYGYLNHLDVISKLKKSDVLWMMIGKGKNADTISSGKLFEYFGARKPIIACLPDGALKTLAIEYKASFISEPDDVQKIKENIINVYNLYRMNQLPEPNQEFVEKYRRDYLTELLTKEFQFLIKED